MTDELATAIIKRFIARADVKAQQVSDDAYMPVREMTASGRHDGPYIPWSRADMSAHLTGTKTYGHYMLDRDSTCKLFAFDIDLEQGGFLPKVGMPSHPDVTDEEVEAWEKTFEFCNPRELWRDRKYQGRIEIKRQMRLLAHKLASYCWNDFSLPTAVSYSGSKGLHVYAFTGRISGHQARGGAQIVLDAIDFKEEKGKYKHPDFPNFSVEVYPKQETINGEGLGNLMRLPLGRNLKAPKDPTFFVDMTAPMNELRPVDPIYALQGTPFTRPGE